MTTRNINLTGFSIGAIKKILNGQILENVVLQILGYKEIPESNNRFRLLLNDGVILFPYAILATQLNSFIYNKRLEKFTIIVLNNYAYTKLLPDKKIIICLDIEVLIPGDQVNEKISVNVRNECSSNSSSLQVPIPVAPIKTESCSNTPDIFTNRDAAGSSSSTSGILRLDEKISVKVANNNFGIINEGASNSSSHPVSIAAALANTESFSSTPDISTNWDAAGPSNCASVISQVNKISVKVANNNLNVVNEWASNSSLPIVSMPTPPINTESCSRTSDIFSNWDTAGTSTTSSSISQNMRICCISALTPYQNKWTVKARITYKTYIIKYNTSRGQGKFFSFYLIDHSGEMRVTAFDEYADRIFETIKLNRIYFISKGIVKPARENCPVKCEFEIIVNENSKIQECIEDEASFPSIAFNFCTIDQIMSLSKDSYVDVIGVCDNISGIITIITKSDKTIVKRNFSLMDKSEKSLTITLWNSDAEHFSATNKSVISIKNAKVSDFGGCSLSITSMSMVFIEPEIRETLELHAWFQNLDSSSRCQFSILDTYRNEASQNWKVLNEINSFNSECLEVPLYFTTKGTIIYVKKENTLYKACCSPSCYKKVMDLNNGFYRCNKCDKDYNTFKWSMLLCFRIADFSGSLYAVSFQETSENLIGKTSEECSYLKDEDLDKYHDLLHNLELKSYIFKMRSHVEKFDDRKTLKTSILSAIPVDSVTYTKKLMTDIMKMSKRPMMGFIIETLKNVSELHWKHEQ